ncbi:MAG: hypothetical protein Q9215_002893 [Flavoplaca cf. flavocitrina]
MSLATETVYLFEINALGHAAILEDQTHSGWPASNTEANAPSTITPAPATTQCPPCQVLISAGGGGMSRVFWWNSTLDLTLNTVSVIVTQYNSTAITGSTTIFGNLNSVDAYDISEAREIQYLFNNPQYPNQPKIVLVNDTDRLVEGSLSFPYPTSYLVVPGYIYYTQTASSGRGAGGCPAGQTLDNRNNCVCKLATAVADGYDIYPEFSANDTQLAQTFYETMATVSGIDFVNQLKNNIISYDVASFSSWLAPIISPRPPQFESCYFPPVFVGPPALKVPVSALTATITTTVRGTERYDWTTATPALTPSHELPAETSAAATNKEDEPNSNAQPATDVDAFTGQSPSGAPKDPETRTLASPPSEIVSGRSTYTLDPSSNNVIASKVLPGSDDDPEKVGTPMTLPNGDDIVFSRASIRLPPEQSAIDMSIMPISGSIYTMDKPSNIVIEGQTITPGGLVTVSGSVISVPTIADSEATAFPIFPTPIVSFHGSIYTADQSSNIVVEGQTVALGGAFTVSGNVISVPTMQPIQPQQNSISTPVVSFLGSIVTMDMSSNFVFGGETVKPGSAVTISGSILSVPPLNGFQGQSFSQQSIPTIPLLSFGSSTYTMDMSSNFILGGKTIAPGSAITISGTVISRPTGDSLVVVGGVTKTLSELVTTRDIQASPTAEATDIASGDSVTAGNPEELSSVTPTASAGADGLINPADFESTASASAIRLLSVVVSGLCIGLGFTASLL